MKRLLIANRGEIALRIMRSAKEFGLSTIAVYSEADRGALHVRYADEAYLLGPAASLQSYLNMEKLVAVAQRAGADAVHPGYGFLAENAAFARAVIAAGMTWVGPHPEAIEAMGDKIRARQAMLAASIAVVPGGAQPIDSLKAAKRAARDYGLPLALKASRGGGGKGLRVAHTLDEIESAFNTARREAQAYFKDGTIYAERYLDNPKHIELQILADKHGNVVQIGERDCSLQRRHQKLFEETPAQIDESVRARLREAGIRAAQAIAYDSVGTIETLVEGDDFFFLEMNTRIQVEHTISEMVSGIDLIREQLRVAAGEPLGYAQSDVRLAGHAIEVRVNAEDPTRDFQPAPGTLTTYREPAGLGVRVDSAAVAGMTITPEYDSMIAKLIVAAPTREQALARLRRAIDDYAIAGVPTTLAFLRALSYDARVLNGTYGTGTLEAFAAGYREAPAAADAFEIASLTADEVVRVEVNDKLYFVRVIDNQRWSRPEAALAPRRPPRPKDQRTGENGVNVNDVLAPMPGVVVELGVAQGTAVAEGQLIAVIEAMKMMNEIRAPRAGTVVSIHVNAGANVEANAPLVTLA